MERWRGQVAVVTGASSGIGAYIVELLVRAGMKVVGLARRIEILEETARRLAKQPGTFYPIKCDLRKEDNILQAFKFIEEKLGAVSVLINNAAYLVPETIIDGETDTYRKIFDLNILAVTICIREASKSMRKHKVKGHIVNMNSVAGHDAAGIRAPVSVYCASKYAVTGLTESVRNELSSARSGIKITSISPGTVRTDMIRAAGIPDEVIDKVSMLEPKDVADAVVYALSTPPNVQVNELTITTTTMTQ